MAQTPGTDIEILVRNAQELVAANHSVSMGELLRALSPQQVSAPAPAKVPAPRKITDSQRAAIERMPKVYGKVVPAERRALEPAEIETLLGERTTLDEVKKAAEARLADITVIAHNHLDVEVEQEMPEGERPLLDDKGHYIHAARFGAENLDVEFSREVRESAPSLDVAALQALEEAGEIDHKTFLSMTTQVRVVDEDKVMAAIKKDPSLLAKVAKATKPGKTSTSMYVRPRK